MRTPRFRSVILLLAATGSASCFDPVHDDQVTALGPEVAGVPEGPTHRPGQPCRTCHGGDGPGSPEWSIAGTMYRVRNEPGTLEGVRVILTDSSANPVEHIVTSNSAGNFYIPMDDWSPTFPVFVRLEYGGGATKMRSTEMLSPIGRNGGCGFCHYGADNEPGHMPPVFLAMTPFE